MSLNKALTELFKAIREEAQANPAFAQKLEDALVQFKPSRKRRRVAAMAPAAQVQPVATPDLPPEPPQPKPEPAPKPDVDLNPIAVFSRDGEDGLREALEDESLSRAALAALVAEHNLDPAGAVADGDKPALIEQIVASARKRVERDKRLFDY